MTTPATPASDNQPGHSAGKKDAKRPLFRQPRFYAFIALPVILAILVGSVLIFRSTRSARFTGPTYLVKKAPMEVTIVERGSLESAENSDIIVRVKAGSRGSTIASTIKWVIEDGTQVKLGDKLVELDDSGFQDSLKTQRNTVAGKYSDWIQAKADYVFQPIDNESKIKTAEVALMQAHIELKKYTGDIAGVKVAKLETQDDVRAYLTSKGQGGVISRSSFDEDVKVESALSEGKFTSAYLQELNGYLGTIETATSDRDTWIDRASWSQRMVKKGFYSVSQADADQSRLASMEIALRKAQGDLDIYRIFEREKNVIKKWSDVKEAERALAKERLQAESKIEQKKADEAAKKSIYDQELDRLRDMDRDEKWYTMYAPQDGMVVYFIPEQARFGGGSQQSTVAQGEPVRESQKLMRIPNLAKMLVNTKVHEATVKKVEPETLQPTGYSDSLRIPFSLGRFDLFGIAAYQIGFESARDSYREKDFVVNHEGQRARIRVDAHPGRIFKGRVKSVATVPSQGDFLSADVKLYPTMVSIDDIDPIEDKLKPGMSAEVTIRAAEIREPIIAIPIQSVVGNVKMHADRKCYVLDASGVPRERNIKLGRSNDTMVEVLSGIQEDENVVLNPRPLIPENSDMRVGTPSTKRGAEADDGGGPKTGKKKDAAKKGPPDKAGSK